MELRQQMVEQVRPGRSPEELSWQVEPSAQAIRNWVSQAERDEGRRADGLTSAEREELRRLREVGFARPGQCLAGARVQCCSDARRGSV